MTTQFSGGVFVRKPNGSIGDTITGATVEFIKEDRSSTFNATSDGQGRYSISLPEGSYFTRATHATYQDYTSTPDFLVASGTDVTCNFLLVAPPITTVIVVRHCEKQDATSTAQNEPLGTLGERRARTLLRVLFRAGVTRIFHTNTVRTRDTAKPLAEAFQLQPTVYDYPTSDQTVRQIVDDVLENNRGDVVLVVAHSNSISTVVRALGASENIPTLDGYDNMFIVSRAGSDVKVTNLPYGATDPVPSYRMRTAVGAMTVLMVGFSDQSPIPSPLAMDLAHLIDLSQRTPGPSAVELAQISATSPVAQQLFHAACGSRISALYMKRDPTPPPVVPPPTGFLRINPRIYTHAEIPHLVNVMRNAHRRETVVVSGTHGDLRAMIRQFGGQVPILYPSDVNHLIVLTQFASGAVRVVPLRM